jgi:murein tripeptide amidase MpaA
MKISSHFDSGNIQVIKATSANDIQLSINKDSNADFLQWFHFRAQGLKDTECTFKIMNAGETSYTKGWEDYRAVASYDRQSWFRVDTSFDGKTLTISHTPEQESVFYAYFAPYSYDRHLDLLHTAQLSDDCEMLDLGETVDGRDLSMLVAGNPDGKKLWFIARQHPGESMAEWFMEGLIDRLLDADDPIAKAILAEACVYIVPNMNPDGSARGNLRSNAAGANLNREWAEPSMKTSPEVFLVRQKMHETGCDFFMDVHGDEALPYNFIACCEGNPSYSPKQKALEEEFSKRFIDVNPDFQDKFGYAKDTTDTIHLKKATNYVGEAFGCLSMTLEMPFKDNANSPDELFGWSPERAIKLGESSLTVVHQMLQKF